MDRKKWPIEHLPDESSGERMEMHHGPTFWTLGANRWGVNLGPTPRGHLMRLIAVVKTAIFIMSQMRGRRKSLVQWQMALFAQRQYHGLMLCEANQHPGGYILAVSSFATRKCWTLI